jgi:hypothetical protein
MEQIAPPNIQESEKHFFPALARVPARAQVSRKGETHDSHQRLDEAADNCSLHRGSRLRSVVKSTAGY